jgi:hypothetical protein
LFLGQVEKDLKILLPFIDPNASAKDIENLKEYREKLKLKTLGNTIKTYLMSCYWVILLKQSGKPQEL